MCMEKRKILIILSLGIFIGLLAGYFLFSEKEREAIQSSQETSKGTQVWTCSMHPQIRQEEPGQCPICGMDLIPVETAGDRSEASYVSHEGSQLFSQDLLHYIGTHTFRVVEQPIVLQKKWVGQVEVNEEAIRVATARSEGRIEKLYISSVGTKVKQGQPLGILYSPSLISAQKVFLQAIKQKEQDPRLYETAKNRLKEWFSLSDKQIDKIEATGKVIHYLPILSPVEGVVTEVLRREQDYVKPGDPIFRVADLKTIWVYLEVFEQDKAFLREGLSVEIIPVATGTPPAKARITYIEPLLDPVTKNLRVRIEVSNPNGTWFPGMDVEVKSQVTLSKKAFLLPKSAVLWSGNQSLVYVLQKQGGSIYLEPRIVGIEGTEGDFYVVTKGLQEGEEVLAEGVFLVDANAQLTGKPSLMTMASFLTSRKKYTLPEAVKSILDDFLEAYFHLQKGLVEENHSAIQQAIHHLFRLGGKQPYLFFTGQAKYPFQSQWLYIEKILIQMRKEKDIEKLRHFFAQLSQALISLFQTYEYSSEKKFYVAFCPMAEGNQGAYWLTLQPLIQNPYFGKKMLKCGKIIEDFFSNPSAGGIVSPSSQKATSSHSTHMH